MKKSTPWFLVLGAAFLMAACAEDAPRNGKNKNDESQKQASSENATKIYNLTLKTAEPYTVSWEVVGSPKVVYTGRICLNGQCQEFEEKVSCENDKCVDDVEPKPEFSKSEGEDGRNKYTLTYAGQTFDPVRGAEYQFRATADGKDGEWVTATIK